MMRAAVVVLVLIATAARAGADDTIAPLDPDRDVPIIVVGGALHLFAERAFAPDACRWCGSNPIDRGVRDALAWDDPTAPARISDVTGFLALPALGLGLLGASGGGNDFGANAAIVVQAAVLALDAGTIAKLAAARERPFVHDLAPADKADTARPSENNLSFYSGHSTLAMAVAVAAGTTASMRGYRHARLVWATGVPLALATGYLRIAADRHWSTDVVTGWVTGAAIGFAVPYFLHRRGRAAVTPIVARTETATTVGVAVTW